MERYLKPQIFDIEPSAANSSKLWLHWLKSFNNFISALSDVNESAKLSLLINHVSTSVYDYIGECANYEDALKILKELYEKPTSEVFARHKLLTRTQTEGETLDQFMNTLKQLSKECDF